MHKIRAPWSEAAAYWSPCHWRERPFLSAIIKKGRSLRFTRHRADYFAIITAKSQVLVLEVASFFFSGRKARATSRHQGHLITFIVYINRLLLGIQLNMEVTWFTGKKKQESDYFSLVPSHYYRQRIVVVASSLLQRAPTPRRIPGGYMRACSSER